MMTYERLAQILLANGVNSPAELEKVLRYVLVLRDRPLPLDCPAGGGGSNQEGAGDPGGALMPDFVGQRYKDTNTGNIWIANSTTPGDWTLEVQNMELEWTPTNLKLGELAGLGGDDFGNLVPPMPGIVSLTVLAATKSETVSIAGAPNLVSISFPNLTTLTTLNGVILLDSCPLLQSCTFPLLVSTECFVVVKNCPSLTTIDASSLQSVTGGVLSFNGDTSLVVLNLPNLISASSGIVTIGCSALTTINAPSLVPINAKSHIFTGCALNAATVNGLLARGVANAGFVSGKIDTSGGTSAAPTGQGIIDKATLNARLAGLAVTN